MELSTDRLKAVVEVTKVVSVLSTYHFQLIVRVVIGLASAKADLIFTSSVKVIISPSAAKIAEKVAVFDDVIIIMPL